MLLWNVEKTNAINKDITRAICGIVYHYRIYRDRPLIGRSDLLYACTIRFLALLEDGRDLIL